MSPVNEQRAGFRSNWFLVQFMVGLAVAQVLVLAMSASCHHAEILLIKRGIAGGPITAAEAARIDSWDDLLMKLILGLAIVDVILFIVWLVRASRNARALTGKNIEFNAASIFFFNFWVHKLLGDLWLAGTPDPEAQQAKPRTPPLMIAWCVLIFVCNLWHPPMSTGQTLSEAIELTPRLRPSMVGWLLERCQELFIADLVHIFSTVLLAAGIVWIERMHARKWAALTAISEDSAVGAGQPLLQER